VICNTEINYTHHNQPVYHIQSV